jgi:hypothetical protein
LRRAPSLESLFVATFALLGLRIGLRPLGDNSLFIHLRTGIDLVRTGHVPRSDGYTFTSAGHPWVVQSWLASAAYGVAERLGGFAAVRVLHGMLYALLAWLLARLAHTGSAGRTALAAFLTIGVGIVYWSPRPLAFGLLGLAATVLVVERRRSWWWLLPIVWVWANAHGSFVLGLAWLFLVVVGERIDGQRRPDTLPWLGGFVAGLAIAVVNPLGPRLLVFPLVVIGRRDAFAHVAEWRSPSFQGATGGLTLLCLVGAFVVIARRRQPWRDLLPVAGFVLAALVAQRNLPMAGVVLAPVLARALRPETAPATDDARRASAHLAIAGLLGALGLLFVAMAATGPALDLEGYPVRAARLYDRPARVVTTDSAAGYLVLLEGDEANVLIDDRVDLHPLRVTKDYIRLLDGRPDGLRILDRYDADVVVWETDRALSAQLAASSGWRRAGTRDGWAVWVRAAARS